MLKSRPGERFHDKLASRVGDGNPFESLINDAELAEAEDVALRSEDTDHVTSRAPPEPHQHADMTES